MTRFLRTAARVTSQFKLRAQQILARQDASVSRVVTLEATRKQLAALAPEEEDLLDEAIVCVETGLYRAAPVMAWAAFMHCLTRLLGTRIADLKKVRPGWSHFKSIEEIAENVTDHQLVEVARDIKLISKQRSKVLMGLLARRNECAHPGYGAPDLNEAIGFIAEILKEMKALHEP